MEILKNYIENMFMNLPKTEEVLRAKQELLNMMEDKYNELKSEGKTENEAVGTVISEFGNLEELAEELGIAGWVNTSSTFSGFEKKNNTTAKKTSNVCRISYEQCRDYVSLMKKSANKIALGVALCICSPILLIVMGGMHESGFPVSEGAAAAVGLTVLLCMVAAAVVMFITEGMKMSATEHYKKEILELEESTQNCLREERKNRMSVITTKIAVGVAMCILAVVPVVVMGGFYEENEALVCGAVGLLLFVVAAAVVLFIQAGMEDGAYKVLLQEEDYTVQRKKADSLVDKISAVYWPLVAGIYFLWSFISWNWAFTWIIWPVAGILFAVIAGICSLVSGVEE